MSKKEIFLRNLKAADLKKGEVAKAAIKEGKKRIREQIRKMELCLILCLSSIGFGTSIVVKNREVVNVISLICLVIVLCITVWARHKTNKLSQEIHKLNQEIQESKREYEDSVK